MRSAGMLDRLRDRWGDQLVPSLVAAVIVGGTLVFYIYFSITHS